MQNRKRTEAKLLAKAAQDPSFRAALIADPKGAIEGEFGVKLPPDTRVHVLQEEPNTYYVVLPLNPETRGDGQISDQQLEAVVGGNCYCDCGCDINCDVNT